MFRVLAMALMAVLLTGPGASAENNTALPCDETLSQTVYNVVQDLRAGRRQLDDTLPSFDGAATRCPKNAFALHYAALAHFTKAQALNQARAGGEAIMAELETAFRHSQSFWALDNRDQTFPVMSGYTVVDVEITYEEKSNFRQDLIKALLDLHVRASLSHPYIRETSVPASCGDAFYYDVLGARSWLRNNPAAGEAALALAGRLGEACPLSDDFTPRLIHKNLTAMRLSRADTIAETDPDAARALLEKVRVFRGAMLGEGETSNYHWSEYDESRLKEVADKLPNIISIPTETEDPLISPGPVPVEDWFQPDTDPMKVREAMCRTLDAHVAARGLQGFVSAMGKIYAATIRAPDPAAAKLELYEAARSYDAGSWRSADTQDVEIFDSGYTWLKDSAPESTSEPTGSQ